MKARTFSKPQLVLILVFLLTSVLTTACYGGLTGQSYCQLTIGIAQQDVGHSHQLLALTQTYCEDPNFFQAYCNDPNCFLEQKLILQERFDSNEAVLFGDFNTTADEYAAFMGENEQAVEEYLNNEPNIKRAIDNLSGQIDKILKELEIPSYCLLTIANARQEIDNLNESVALAQEYSNDKNTFLEQEQIKRKEFDNDRQALFESFDTTAQEYITFMGENPKAVETYLNDHPDIKQTIDDFSNQVNTLLEEYETLRESIVETSAEEVPH